MYQSMYQYNTVMLHTVILSCTPPNGKSKCPHIALSTSDQITRDGF